MAHTQFVVGTCENEGDEKCAKLSFCDECEKCPDHCNCGGQGMDDAAFSALIERF